MKADLIEEIRNSLSNIWKFNTEGKTENLQHEIAYIRRLIRKEELKNEEALSLLQEQKEEKEECELCGGNGVYEVELEFDSVIVDCPNCN